jgi:2'-5' RNA ligase
VRQELDSNNCKALRFTQPQAFHLTLRFLGDVAMTDIGALQEAVRRSCEDVVSLQLRIGAMGCFPNSRNPRVVWAGVDGELDTLRHLQSRVVQETAAFGEPPETRLYQPHLTLARVNTRDRQVARLIGQSVERPAAASNNSPVTDGALDSVWTASEVHLIRSELLPGGSRYTTLGSFPFRSAAA